MSTQSVLGPIRANGKKHQRDGRQVRVAASIDTFTSAPWFDGWREVVRVHGLEAIVRPIARAHTWLMSIGWRRHGLLSVNDVAAAG